MGKQNKAGVFTILFIIGCLGIAKAQINVSNWQVGVNGGIFVYQGDLTPSTLGSYKTVKPTLSVYVSRILSPSFLLRTNLAVGQLKGDEAKYSSPAYRRQRNLSFTTPVTELSELLVWNMFGNNSNEIGNKFSPYLFGGVGVSFLSVKRASNLNKSYFTNEPTVAIGLAADMRVNPPKAILVVPVGVGIEYYLTPHVALTAETNFRYTRTDYLDGFSKVTNTNKNDFYQSHTVGLVYKFGKKNQLGCPVLKY